MIKKIILSLLFFFFSKFSFAQVEDCGKPPGDQPPKMGCPDPSGNCPPNPGGGSPTGGTPISVPVQGGKDPNAIIGTAGYDTTIKWVSVKNNLPYKIYFENDPEQATGPAQKVVVYLPIHPKLNPASFRLGDFGFGSFNFTVSENSTVYTNRLDVRDSLGLYVDITAGLDITNRRAFWIFESIDPATGLSATLPPNSGFLPINDSITHKGEGYVTLTLQPASTAQTRDTASAQATIIFDTEDPISTNIWLNTIDAVAPTSIIASMPALVDSVFTIAWSGRDDTLGVGIRDYALYYSKNNGPYTLYQDKIDTTAILFSGDKGSVYSFYTLSTDLTGNKETKTKGDDTVTVKGNAVFVSVKAFLQGSYQTGSKQMTDNLRAQLLLPVTEPYKNLGFTPVNNTAPETPAIGIFDTTGSKAITDWVWLELRNNTTPSQIVATRSALIRRDGTVVNMDGISPVYFNNVAEGSYYVAIRHRNHLGVMTANAVSLNQVTETVIDFTNPATATYGTNAERNINGVMAMWAGDVNGNKQVRYNGAANDKNIILSKVGLNTSNNVLLSVYDRADTNLDGKINYNGAANDKNVILSSVGLLSPNNVIIEQIPN